MFQVRHELASKVFTCCSFIIKHDYKVTIYLLPHILLYMLLGCTRAEQQEVRTQTQTFTPRLHMYPDKLSRQETIQFCLCVYL